MAIPPPSPPSVNAGLIIAGKPIFLKLLMLDYILLTISDFGKSKPISIIFFLNFFLSSALAIAFEFAPINSILYFFKIPFFQLPLQD